MLSEGSTKQLIVTLTEVFFFLKKNNTNSSSKMFQHTHQTFGAVYRSGFFGLITLKK